MPENDSKRSTRIALTVATLAITSSGFAYAHTLSVSLENTRREFALSTSTLQSSIEELKQQLADVTTQNESLTSVLSEAQKKSLALEDEKTQNQKKITTLTKLTTIDPELLKKYSKVFFLSENYNPPKLRNIDSKYLIDTTKQAQILDKVSTYINNLLEAADREGLSLKILSAYRSFGTQSTLKSKYNQIYGAGTANQFSADQGYSEHQLGTAVDFTTTDIRGAEITFENSPEFKWLTDNAYKFGFILSYPKSNTYYVYEPWHWRFVGIDLAGDLYANKKFFYELDQRDIDRYLLNIFG